MAKSKKLFKASDFKLKGSLLTISESAFVILVRMSGTKAKTERGKRLAVKRFVNVALKLALDKEDKCNGTQK